MKKCLSNITDRKFLFFSSNMLGKFKKNARKMNQEFLIRFSKLIILKYHQGLRQCLSNISVSKLLVFFLKQYVKQFN